MATITNTTDETYRVADILPFGLRKVEPGETVDIPDESVAGFYEHPLMQLDAASIKKHAAELRKAAKSDEPEPDPPAVPDDSKETP